METPNNVFAAKDRFGGIGLVRDPHEQLRELRESCPVHHGSVSGLFGVVGPDNFLTPDDEQVSVFRWDDVDVGFKDAATFSNSYYVQSLRAVVGRTILEMDPPEHQRYRALLQGAFTKYEMTRWETDFVRDLVERRLLALRPAGRGDLAADFAFHYPISVIAVACRPAGRPHRRVLRAGGQAHQRVDRRRRADGGQRAARRRWPATSSTTAAASRGTI